MKLNEFFDHLDVTEAPKKFPEGHYTHTPGALAVMPSQDQTMWADAGELPKKFNVTKMKIAIYDEGDDQDPYSYGNGGLIVYHNAGTWKMYTDDVTRVQIADYLGIPNKDIDFSEQGMQSEEYMHFDIEDDTVAQLIGKGAFKLEETVDEAHELDRADKIVLAKLMKEYEGYKSMVAKAKDADDSKMYQERLRDLVSMIKHVKGEMKYGIDTALEDELSDMYDAVKGVKEDDPTSTKLSQEEIKQKALLYMMRQHTYRKDRRQYDADNSGNADKFYTEQDIENLEAMIAHLKDGASLDPALQDKLAKVLRDAKVKDRTGRFAMRKMDLAKQYQDELRKYKPLEMGEDINDIVRLSGIK
ncbi:MAG: hypothetical protein VW270_29305 [Candidatus Poseidoniales archaeon]